jgi:hypothetical protein
MNLKHLVLLSACAALVAGCSSVPTRVNHGPVQGATYTLMASKAPASVVVNERREEVHRVIQSAIAGQLGQKGLRAVPTGGDVEVGYLVIVADNASTAAYDEYFGYGRESGALADKAHKEVSKSNSRNRFEIGAIVIDVVNPRDGKLLFRCYERLDISTVNPGNRTERINALVGGCLADLRVAR